jgi:hypothetical protein
VVAARLIALSPAVLLAALVTLAGGAPARADVSAERAARPWATVNVCDTAGHPDGIGVRGSMPGTGDRRDALSMRIELQYLRRSDGHWVRGGRAGDSGTLDVGHGDARVRQAGRTFTIAPPDAGRPAHLLRALVMFEWRRDGTLLRRARRVTRGGHADTPGADPSGHSAATCAIR